MILRDLYEKKLIHPPEWLIDNCMYLTYMGSVAYGVESQNSDNDYYGFTIPRKEMLFPHLAGEIQGFGTQAKRFDQWQEHNVFDQSGARGKGQVHDLTVYSIVKYFHLCMSGNPNMTDSIFTPPTCVIHSTKIGELVRENRKLFLHKGLYHKFVSYAFSQISKMSNKDKTGKRAESIEVRGYDVKYAYHLIRLCLECQMILEEYDLDLMRNKDILKDVRAGNWKEEDIRSWFAEKERFLQRLYTDSKIPYGPDEPKIKQLLLDCLEMHYGNLKECIISQGKTIDIPLKCLLKA